MDIRNFLKNICRYNLFLFSIGILSFSIAIAAFYSLVLQKNNIFIAVVLPSDTEQYKSTKDALEIYASDINAHGGIKGNNLEIEFYFDDSELNKAREVANRIVNNKQYLAVVGHFDKKITESVISIYEQAKIPLIVPNLDIETTSEWVFQLKPSTESYGNYLAAYTKKVLNKTNVNIIYSDDEKNNKLVRAFTQEFEKISGVVQAINLHDVNDLILNEIKASKQMLLLAIDNKDKVVDLIKKVRKEEKEDQAVIVTSKEEINQQLSIMLTSPLLGNHIEKGELDNRELSNLYIPALMFLDSLLTPDLSSVEQQYKLNYRKKTDHKDNPDYKQHLNHEQMNLVLSTSLIVNSLENLLLESYEKTGFFIDKNVLSIKQVSHETLKEALGKIKVKHYQWFNENREGNENLYFLGTYRNKQLISAPINPTFINKEHILNLTENDKEKIITIGEENQYPAKIVYSGIAINKISDFNSVTSSYNMDFFLWFRSSTDSNDKKCMEPSEQADRESNCVDNIEFLNTVKPTLLLEAVQATIARSNKEKPSTDINQMSAVLVDDIKSDGQHYRRYHITGRFYTINKDNYALGLYEMFIRFRHYNENNYKLTYVSDHHNSNRGVFNLETTQVDAVNKAKFNVVDDPYYTLDNSFIYTYLSEKAMLGRPKGVEEDNYFSHFIAEYHVKPVLWSFRGIISWINDKASSIAATTNNTSGIITEQKHINLSLMVFLLSISAGIFIFTRYGQRKELFNHTSSYWWFLQLFISFFILLFSELVLTQVLLDMKNAEKLDADTLNTLMNYTKYTISILWWLIPAYYITSALQQFLWDPISRQTGAKVPNILRLFAIIVIYALAILGIIIFVFELTIEGLAATSGVIAILFALASKIDLSNIIAGLGISLSKTFKLEDWVKVGDITGKVTGITPKSIKLWTNENHVIDIPNKIVNGSIITNFTALGKNKLAIQIKTADDCHIETVEKVLLEALNNLQIEATHAIALDPQPSAKFEALGDGCHLYEVVFFITDYGQYNNLRKLAYQLIANELIEKEIKSPISEHFISMSTPVAINS